MRWKKATLALVLLLLIYSTISFLQIIYVTARTPFTLSEKEFDMVIIPGQGTLNGSLLPDKNHRDINARLSFVLELFYKQMKKPTIILSGYGRGYRYREHRDQEAQVMYAVLAPKLQERGYDSHQYFILENNSHHTIENAIYSRQFLSPGQRILVLAPAKSYQRADLVFSTVLNDYQITVYSLTPQTPGERRVEWLRTAGTIGVLILPGSTIKHSVGEWAFRRFADESCRKEGYLLNRVICDPH